jgi:hypothetical protein
METRKRVSLWLAIVLSPALTLAQVRADVASGSTLDFDGDGKSDVFAVAPRADGAYQWMFSSGGVKLQRQPKTDPPVGNFLIHPRADRRHFAGRIVIHLPTRAR